MATAGPSLPGTGSNDATVGTIAWGTPTSIQTNNSVMATNVRTSNGSHTSNYLKAVGFGFAIPAGATINGITVGIEKYQQSGTGTGSGNIKNSEIKLLKAGVIGATNRADTVTSWQVQSPSGWASTPSAPVEVGGPADLWGDTWSSTDINNASFGVVLAALVTRTGGKGAAALRANVDQILITITYTPANAKQQMTQLRQAVNRSYTY